MLKKLTNVELQMYSSVREKLDVILFSMLGSRELVEKWWVSPNKAFNMNTPLALMEDKKHEVIDYVLGHALK